VGPGLYIKKIDIVFQKIIISSSIDETRRQIIQITDCGGDNIKRYDNDDVDKKS